ncbi:MAG: hypothetical protein ACPG19_11610 [Saprospiraceae bacterium]|mgnify:CR=1 FL=1
MKYIAIIGLALLTWSCGSNTQKGEEQPQYTDAEMESDLSKCVNDVQAIFQDTSYLIRDKSFEIVSSHAIEKATFETGMSMELHQSGCKILKQRYQFNIPIAIDEKENASFWVKLVASQFKYMSRIVPQFEGYQNLVLAGEETAQLGETLQITNDATYKIDRFVQGDETILVVEFELES